VPEPTASPAPKLPSAPNALWAGIRALAIHPSRQEVFVSLPGLTGELQMVPVLVSRN
jgi:hypothetical protein